MSKNAGSMSLPIGSAEWDKARCLENLCPLDDYPNRAERIILNCPWGKGHDATVNTKTVEICPRTLPPHQGAIDDVDFNDFTYNSAP